MDRPLSVFDGIDSEVIPLLLSIHAPDKPKILDCTHNKGVMWRGLEYRPIRMDIDSTLDLDVAGDFTAMPFADGSFDVVVFDPPHLPTHAASPGSSGIYKDRYGITDHGSGREGDNVCGMFAPFLTEAKRVLKDDGIILAKLADLTHNHRTQWQHVDFIIDAREAGMTPCDLLIKRDPAGGGLKSSLWKNVKHLRKCHCFWIVVRNGKRCEKSKRLSSV